MSTQLNWGKLVSQGRAKAVGISWSDEEGKAISSISSATGKSMAEIAPFIREGILTVEDYNKVKDHSDIVNPYLKLSKDELLKKAQAMGINASPDATKEILAQEISQYEKKGGRNSLPGILSGSGPTNPTGNTAPEEEKEVKPKAKPKAQVKKPAPKPKAKPAPKKVGKAKK